MSGWLYSGGTVIMNSWSLFVVLWLVCDYLNSILFLLGTGGGELLLLLFTLLLLYDNDDDYCES